MTKNRVLHSTLALTIAHVAGYAISLAEIPILARALGPEAYGTLLWVQATALLASVLVDWGFTLSASREIARNRQDQKALRKICGDVLLAKALLLLVVTLPLVMVYAILQPVTLGLAIAGFVYIVAFGMSPFWFFQGMEKMGRAVTIEIVTRSLALLGLILFVNEPQDNTLALSIMATGGLACTATTLYMAVKEVGPMQMSWSGALGKIRQGASIFIYKSGNNLMTTAATTVLGAVAGKASVGIFAPAEKIVKAFVGLALPVLNAFYPHLSRLFVEDKVRKERESLVLTLLIGIAGLTIAFLLIAAGPVLMRWLLGPGYEQASALIMVMLWLIPLRLINQALGFAVLLPAQLENRASVNLLLSSIASLITGAVLAAKFGAIGMAWGMLAGEAGLLIAQLYLARHIILRVCTRQQP